MLGVPDGDGFIIVAAKLRAADVGLYRDDPPVEGLDLLDGLGEVGLSGPASGMVDMLSQISTAIMSAPSWASRIA